MVNIYEKKPDEMKKNYEKICEEYILSLYQKNYVRIPNGGIL